MIFPALIAKFLSAGAIAQAAAGAGVVVVAVTGAGAAGVLPDPVQDTVAGVVETVTPFELPGDEEPTPETVGEEPVVEETVEVPVIDEAPADPTVFDADAWLLGPQEAESFGGWVSAAAGNQEFKAQLEADGLSFGQVVRTWAHRKGMDDAQLESELEGEGLDAAELTEDASEDAPTTEDAEPQVATAPVESGKDEADMGKGNGNGNGKAAQAGSAGKGNGKANGKN